LINGARAINISYLHPLLSNLTGLRLVDVTALDLFCYFLKEFVLLFSQLLFLGFGHNYWLFLYFFCFFCKSCLFSFELSFLLCFFFESGLFSGFSLSSFLSYSLSFSFSFFSLFPFLLGGSSCSFGLSFFLGEIFFKLPYSFLIGSILLCILKFFCSFLCI
jgi:hypothetical protein